MTDHNPPQPAGSVREVFLAFLWLGLTSFGGPIAHLGYFRTEFVERRRWLSETRYAELVTLCQFLPGPASSQVGFALGLMRAGYLGALAAFVAFTLPSALALVLFALGAAWMAGPIGGGIIMGLKVVAVSIVAHAVWGMARNLCPDRARAGIALVAVWIMLAMSGPLGPIAAIVVGAALGLWLTASVDQPVSADVTQADNAAQPVSKWVGIASLSLFALLLVGLPVLVLVNDSALLAVADAFYRAGALVFGGGHVVLPLLQTEIVAPGWVSADAFLAGYGAAQAVPGPLFTFAAYLGTVIPTGFNPLIGATVALLAVFVPGFLLLIGVLPFWHQARQWQSAQAALRGANAAVVGILGAALYTPVWTSTVTNPMAFALALTGFVLLTVGKVPAWGVVILAAVGGVVLL
ncbi:chromate efflux transporter [Salinispirillum sp. LH 10-3-1]|uniref:Chromate efflux transporter n=1 Tax=Salinispirillum sp. LH 10-3-1 TaxID=2952525 RepID=A0AB38YFK4_9GAMM